MRKKAPCIPRIIHDKNLFTDFSKRANIFNSLFTKQWSVIEINSVLPLLTNPITNQFLLNIEFPKDDIKRIILFII